ncbi:MULTISPECIES: DNA cytosine methyltransferase [Lachnospiraceae]|jgi:DNA (cytosine-5)-methyltransferase 1|uniref:DNA (cytosine-5-)-methyltransferase n=1 Tax=Coprococcus comes TaxID=410072 RepID=A0A849XUY5_9FIRM|nr:DNA cytosine methyltransferase [Coprococcus comes]NUN85520.1 DNA cytosine methyltransferase [Coprococcus comes]SCG99074.1 Modification methylase BspRI [uncultured Dorea sp.]SCJ86093.1 Modification methylase BspRI [uncultured Ruminococcus sp.]
MKFKAIDLFCGAGGLSTGLKKSGFRLCLGVDIDEKALKTYKCNLKRTKVLKEDIKKVTGERITELTGINRRDNFLLAGCPPCQGFSSLGKRDANDEKNELVYEYIRIINELEPSFILMENVPGMSTGVGKEIFKNVVKELEENYHVEYATLNAADFGVPQIRKRLVLHGIRNDVYANLGLDKEKQKILPKSTHSKEKKKGYRKWVTVRKAIFDLPILGAGESYDDGIIKNHKARSLSETNIERLQEIRLHGGNREMISEELQLECHKKENVSYTDTYGIIDPDKPAPTITSGCTIISKGRYCHPTQNRGLSIREAARLQSFDDKFEFQGNMGEMSLQIGNAVPPKLAQASGKVIINYMGLYEDYLEAQTKGVITP